MRILLTGGGTGGHFFPIVAVIRALKKMAESEKFVEMELVYLSDSPYDLGILKEEGVEFISVPAGKIRRYFSLFNFTDLFKTAWGIIRAIIYVFGKMPDVIFAKGGYASFPALIAARLFKIPVIIHESDSAPGRVNRWAGSFAKRIAISFPESAKYFPSSKTALIGNPVRERILGGNIEEARSIFGYEDVPTVLVLGGSQGSAKLNDILIDILPEILKEAKIIHQCGKNNFDDVSKRISVVLGQNQFKNRYKLFAFLDENILRSAVLVSNLIVSRAGAGAIYEIAAWGKPSLLIPLHNSAQDHQRQNAYAYARAGGAALVVEEENLAPNLLLAEIRKLLSDKPRLERMARAASNFAKIDAAEILARQIILLALEHVR
ncbi:MAG: undecaprenyldiphospho-muramoylpentapeptide beta-N-acetylglucosaminyltransferase [Candidatus Niyogibacteria bacterium]|nr:MAG: undecaprenyldiphospho-muramoylpentapeptide beta-N-acetylglucosaminyltransferase [Candidatus Niyogibacteria bacterium]